MDSIASFFVNESESVNLKFIRRNLRDKSNPLELPNSEFKKCFRLNKEAFQDILKVVDTHHKEVVRSSSVPTILKLAAVLEFFANGSYQHGIGESFHLGLSQPATCAIFKDIFNILENYICPKWINFQMSEEDKQESKRAFYQKCRIPGVIGCIDGTHIRIFAPKKVEQHHYFNRKGFYSLNAMIVCDYKMFIRYVDAKFPGSCHNSHVWKLSDVRSYLRNKYLSGEVDSWLLGDAGYPLEPYLMTPFRDASERTVESQFNISHSSGRNIVERTIGLLKNRFRCILGVRQLHYSPGKATQIVNICCALHNIALAFNSELEVDLNFIEIEVEGNDPSDNYSTDSFHNAAQEIRRRIVDSI